MTAAEQMFYFGAPLSHVLRYEDHRRRSGRLRMPRDLSESSPRLQQMAKALFGRSLFAMVRIPTP